MHPTKFRTVLAREGQFESVLTARAVSYAALAGQRGLSDVPVGDEFDGMPHSRSYLLLAPDGGIAGTIRATVYGPQFDWLTLPLSNYHPEAMARLATARVPAIQSSLLGVAPEYRTLRNVPTLSLVRAIFATAQAFGIDHLLTLVHPKPARQRLWSRLGWRAVQPPVPHPYSAEGVLLLTGSIAESLRIAAHSRAFQRLACYPGSISGSGRFPEEV